MPIARNASEEFLEEIIYGAAYRYITPWIRQRVDSWFPDEVDRSEERRVGKEC